MKRRVHGMKENFDGTCCLGQWSLQCAGSDQDGRAGRDVGLLLCRCDYISDAGSYWTRHMVSVPFLDEQRPRTGHIMQS